MPRGLDRFLSHRTDLSKGPTLGRAFRVTQETWRLQDDPKKTRPEVTVVATRRTAGEAADIAREAADAFRRRGFHKPSRAWWGADETHFHRYAVHGPRARPALVLMLVSAAAAATALAVTRRSRRRADRTRDSG
jgi:hypothetical protein